MAEIVMILDRTPILLKCDEADGLWYMNPNVTLTETSGVGVNVPYIKIEIIWGNLSEYSDTQLMTFEKGRVEAFESVTCAFKFGFTSRYYRKAKFSVSSRDDNGYDIKGSVIASLDYVD